MAGNESSMYRPKDISTEFITENRKNIGIFQISGPLHSLLICEVFKMLLLTKDKRVINLNCMAVIDTSGLQVYARQDATSRGIILDEYESEDRCYDVIDEICDEYACGTKVYSMPKD